MSASERPDAAVERLLFECLERFAAEGEVGIEQVLAAAPEHAARAREELELLRRSGLLQPPSIESVPERIGEFRLLERLGGGGMGVVYRAVQEPLEREVALKLIRPEHLFFPGARERFRREVLAVARLQHPAIVPVFTVGEELGIPYFAMELVDGATLADTLARLRGRELATLRGSDLNGERESTWSDACVRLVRAIAEALEHAHDRGVLHRDVKPSNIAVTQSGRGLLFDFGLASLGGGGSLTRSGSQPGSLPYMSPEQVRGERELDGRSDVYSLGVVLFEMLTLRSPFASDASFGDALKSRAPGARAPSVRELSPSTPRDLELVCRTALEPERERRYASAADFARDLGNLLARRPIEARRPSVGLRVVRWSQRRPALSAALAAGVLLSLGAVAFELRQQSVHGRELREQRDIARGAATTFLFDFHDAIKDLPGSTPARQLVVQRALELFEKLSKDAGDDEQLQRDLAWGHVRLGEVLGDPMGSSLGDAVRAREQYEQALALYDELLRAAPDDLDLVYRRGYATFYLAQAIEYGGDLAGCLAIYERVIRELEALSSQARRQPRIAMLFAVVQLNYSNALASANRLDEALPVGRRALELCENAGEEPEDAGTASWNILNAHRNLSRILRLRGDHEEAERELDTVFATTERMLRDDPNSDSLQQILAESRLSRGALLSGLGRHDEAVAVLRATRAEFEARREREPHNAYVLRLLLTMRAALATALVNAAQPRDAVGEARAAVSLADESLQIGWDAECERDACDSLRALAEGQRMLGDDLGALESCAALVVRMQRDLVRARSSPPLELVASEHAPWCHEQFAQLAAVEGALETLERAVNAQRDVAARSKTDPAERAAACEAQLVLAQVCMARGDDQRASSALDELARESADIAEAELLNVRLGSAVLRSQLLLRANDGDGAARACAQAAELFERSRSAGGPWPALAEVWRLALIDLARALERGDLVEALDANAQH